MTIKVHDVPAVFALRFKESGQLMLPSDGAVDNCFTGYTSREEAEKDRQHYANTYGEDEYGLDHCEVVEIQISPPGH